MTSSAIWRTAIRLGCLGSLLCAAIFVQAQPTETEPVETPLLDDFTERHVITERQPLKYQPVREADVMWEKRIWRIIDVREKMNLPFTYPEAPLFKIFTDAALLGDLRVYGTEDDKFTKVLSPKEVRDQIFTRDTVATTDVDTGEEVWRVVENELNWESVKRFRLKEAWYFDKNTGAMRVRILGIAPLLNVTDDDGNFLYERPMFWVHYPSARNLLAREKAHLPGDNLAATLSWEDLFEMRYFASSIFKENNQKDRRLQDYLTGVDLLTESQKIEDALFNFEHDVWTW